VRDGRGGYIGLGVCLTSASPDDFHLSCDGSEPTWKPCGQQSDNITGRLFADVAEFSLIPLNFANPLRKGGRKEMVYNGRESTWKPCDRPSDEMSPAACSLVMQSFL
jgi:hypothetical protein